jgi:hypothetical protein
MSRDPRLLSGPAALQRRRDAIRALQARIAPERRRWVERNRYFYAQLGALYRFLVEPGRRVLAVRCSLGSALAAVRPARGLGIELTEELAAEARRAHPGCEFRVAEPEQYRPEEKFDYILVGDTGDIVDLGQVFRNLRAGCERRTRLLIYTHNHLWEPIVKLAARLGLMAPREEQNWLSEADLRGLLELAGYEWLKTHRILLLPQGVPGLSFLLNRVVGALPFVNRLCFISVLVARPRGFARPARELSVSVVVPCKNEVGNVAAAVARIPELGGRTEIIFCDDQSTDGTADEVRRLQRERPDRDIRLVHGPARGKSRNVYAGFAAATGDVLMILDADLAVMPEELPLFLDALAENQAEFANGSRMIYPLPREAMRLANLIGNHFFGLAFTFLLGERIKDTLCGTKALWRDDWRRIEPLIDTWGREDRWGDYELLFGASKLNLRIRDIPVHYQPRVFGQTKMNRRLKNGVIMLQFSWAGFKKLKLRLGA